MQQSMGQRHVTAPAVLGLLLIVLGAAALLARTAGFNLFEAVGPWGWPLFIIVPGLVLLGASLLPARPHGIGFATAGAIVTTVGLILLYQWRTDHWESWAYAWALLPGAAGLAQVAYGLYAEQRAMVNRGLWMTGIAGALFVVGAWFFEGLFAGQPRPLGLDWGPIALIVLGAVVAARALFRQAEPAPEPPGEAEAPATPATDEPHSAQTGSGA